MNKWKMKNGKWKMIPIYLYPVIRSPVHLLPCYPVPLFPCYPVPLLPRFSVGHLG